MENCVGQITNIRQGCGPHKYQTIAITLNSSLNIEAMNIVSWKIIIKYHDRWIFKKISLGFSTNYWKTIEIVKIFNEILTDFHQDTVGFKCDSDSFQLNWINFLGYVRLLKNFLKQAELSLWNFEISSGVIWGLLMMSGVILRIIDDFCGIPVKSWDFQQDPTDS